MNRTDLEKPFERIIKLSSVMQATEFENRFQYWSRSQLLNLQFFINQYNSFWSESTLTRKVLQGSIISFLLHTLLFLIMPMTCLKQLIDISYYILIIPVSQPSDVKEIEKKLCQDSYCNWLVNNEVFILKNIKQNV